MQYQYCVQFHLWYRNDIIKCINTLHFTILHKNKCAMKTSVGHLKTVISILQFSQQTKLWYDDNKYLLWNSTHVYLAGILANIFRKIYLFFVISKINNYSSEEKDFEHLILGVFDKLFNHNKRNVTKNNVNNTRPYCSVFGNKWLCIYKTNRFTVINFPSNSKYTQI